MARREQFPELQQQKGEAKRERAARKSRQLRRAPEIEERKTVSHEMFSTCEIPGCATAVGLGRKSGLCRYHDKEGLDLFFASESDPEVLTKVERWVNMGFEPIEIGRLLLQEKYRQKEKS